MAANPTTRKTNLCRTIGTVAILVVLGLLWLAFFGSSSQSSKGGQDFISPSASPLASAGAGFQPLDPALLTSVSAASVAETVPGSGDNVTVLVLAGASALAFSTLVVFSTLRPRFGGLPWVRVHLRQVTGA